MTSLGKKPENRVPGELLANRELKASPAPAGLLTGPGLLGFGLCTLHRIRLFLCPFRVTGHSPEYLGTPEPREEGGLWHRDISTERLTAS